MKNSVTVFLAALLCLSLMACSAADTRNNPSPLAAATAPVVSIEDAIQSDSEEAIASTWAVNKNITFSLLQDTYPTGTQKLTMLLENRGDETLTYGEIISFEKYIDGQWKPVSTIKQYAFTDIAYLLAPHSVNTFTIDAWFIDKPLDPGLYRVTGSEVWTGEAQQRATYPAWQLEFCIANDAQSEPDFMVYVPGQALQAEDSIPVYLINTTGKTNSILRIPHLDRETASGQWEEVPYADNIGFCGTSDPLSAGVESWSEPIQTLWGSLTPGRYRLNYDITGNETVTRTAGGEFVLEEQLCGLPLAEASE